MLWFFTKNWKLNVVMCIIHNSKRKRLWWFGHQTSHSKIYDTKSKYNQSAHSLPRGCTNKISSREIFHVNFLWQEPFTWIDINFFILNLCEKFPMKKWWVFALDSFHKYYENFASKKFIWKFSVKKFTRIHMKIFCLCTTEKSQPQM